MDWTQFKTQEELDTAVSQWFDEEGRVAMQAAGPTSPTAELLTKQALSEEEHEGSLIGDAFTAGNIGAGLYNTVERKLMYEPDPEFKLGESWDELVADIDPMYWSEFEDVQSHQEGLAVRMQIERELEAQRHLMAEGATGMGALLLAGTLDIDLPLMFLSGGESLVAKMGLQSTKMGKWFARSARARRIFGASTAGAVEGAALGALDVLAHPTSTMSHLPQMIFANSMMSGGVSGLTKAQRSVNNSFSEAQRLNSRLFDDPNIGMDRLFNNAGDSAGHAVFNAPDVSIAANRFIHEIDQTASNSPLADAFVKFLDKTPFRTDFGKMWNSESAVLKTLAYELFESPAGIVRNNRTGAMLDHMYSNRIVQAFVPESERAYKKWAQEQGVGNMDIHWDTKMRKQFNRDVYLELQRRLHGGPEVPIHPQVKKAADASDMAGEISVNAGKGEIGDIAIDGFETLQPRKGYVRQIWKSEAIMDSVGKYGERRVRRLLEQGYAKAHPNMKPEDLKLLSKAIIRRSRGKSRDMDTSLMSLMTSDGRQFLREALIDSKVSKKDADRIVRAMSGPIEERGKASFAKSRVDIDLRESDGELSLIDLVETDLTKVWSHYARDLGGRAALARKGIKNKAQLSELFDTIVKEDPNISRQFLEDVFTHFEPGPIAGGVGPNVRRMLQTTNLSLLNQLGLTQLAETGVVIAAVGVENFIDHSPLLSKVFRRARAGNRDTILDEFTFLTGRIGDEHNLFRDDLALDYARASNKQDGVFLQTLDKALAKGQRLQGFMSGFYQIKAAQQRIAVSAMTNKVMQTIRDGAGLSGRRLEDIGLDSTTLGKIKRYVDDGTVQFNEHGIVDRLNMEDWDIRDAENFALAMNRFTNQVLQRAMAGEGTTWMHKDVGSIFMHLQQFPLLAMQKQVARNARIMDTQTALMFSYGLGTAALAYSAKQTVNGRYDRLDAESVAKGAFGLSNMTGWIPMWSDPLASMLGMEDLRFNHYGPRVGAPIMDAPAVSTMQRLAKLPGALVDAVDGDASYNNVAAIKATPILGNAYGWSVIHDQLR